MARSRRFDYGFAALCGVFVVGLYLDGWAHNHVEGIETFFTPWHGVMYAAFLAVLSLTAINFGRGRAAGRGLREALPVGYGVSLLGLIVYGIAGVGDFIWHTVFGIESTVEALFSPTHIGLLLGATLIRTGPLRAAWQRPDAQSRGWRAQLPMVLSAAYLLASLTFFTQYLDPFGLTPAASPYAPAVASLTAERTVVGAVEYLVTVGVASVFLKSALLMAIVLLLVRRWGARLPFGTITLILTIDVVLMTLMRDRYLSTGPLPLIAVGILGGLAADVLLRILRPSVDRVIAYRAFAFAVPTLLYGLYFAALFLFASGVWWTLPVWSGVMLIAGGIGWLVSFLVLPPPLEYPLDVRAA